MSESSSIRQETAVIPANMLQRAFADSEHRVQLVVHGKGDDHFTAFVTRCSFTKTQVRSYKISSTYMHE